MLAGRTILTLVCTSIDVAKMYSSAVHVTSLLTRKIRSDLSGWAAIEAVRQSVLGYSAAFQQTSS